MSESANLRAEPGVAAARPSTSAEPAAARSNRRTSEGSQSAGSLRRWDYLAVLLTFAWATAIFAAYYVVQKPFAAATAVRLLGVAADGLVAAAIVGGSAGLGLRLIGRLALPRITPTERLAFGTLVGLGAASMLWLAVGLAGLLGPLVALAITLALVVLALGPLRDWWRLRPALPSIPRPLWCYLAVMSALSLIAALTPATDWDGLSYHLTAPARWIEAGRIGWIGAEGPFYYPHLLETLFLPAMLLRGDSAARLLHWIFYPLTLWLVGDLTRRLLPGVAPWRAIAIAASLPMLSQLAGWAYTDVALAALTAAALLALLLGRAARQTAEQAHGDTPLESAGVPGPTSAWIVLAGIFAGLAFGIKYQAFIVPLSLALLLAWWHRARPRGALRQLVLFGLVVALIWLPWPLRNVALTGDPVYPFGSIGRGWDSFRTAAFADSRMESDPARLLALPLSLTLGLNGITVYDGRSGPLFLTLLPLALWFLARRHGDRKERAVLGTLLAVAALHGLLWTAGVATSAATSQSRFLLPLFVLLSPLIAWGWEALAPLTTERSQPIGLVNLLVGVALALSAVHATLETVAAAPFAQLAGLESREDYLDRRLGSLWTASTAVNRLPADSRVLLLWEPRSYYIARPSDPDIILDEFDHRLWLAGGDIRVVAEGLRSEGFTHLVVYERGVEFLQAQSTDTSAGNWARLDALLDAYALETWRAEDGSYALYELVVR